MTTQSLTAPASKGTNISIWVAQVIGAALFIMSGAMKLFTPIPELAAIEPPPLNWSVPIVRKTENRRWEL